MKLARKVGATSQILQVFIRDSSSTTGAGLAGLTSGSSGLTAYYHRDTDTTATAISLVTMTVGTFTSSGFKEIDATNMPGWYQFCPPNAALASGASSCGFHLKGATNMAPLPIEVDLDAQVDVTFWNGTVVATPATAGIPDVNAKNINNVAATSVTTINANIGMTQPINFTGTAGSALVKSDMVDVAGAAVSTSTAQIGVNLVNIGGSASVGAAGYAGLDWGQVTNKTTTNALTGTTISTAQVVASVTGAVGSVTGAVGSVTSGVTVTTNNDKTGYALTQTFPTNFSSLGITAGGHITLVDTLTTYTGNTVQTGDAYARLGAPAGASVSADVAAIKADTGTSGSIYTRIGAPAGASVSADIAAVKTDLDAGVTVVAVTSAASNLKKNTALAGFTFVMTDATTHAPKTGLTVAATRSLNGGAFSSCANAVSEVANGVYTIDLAAGDLNGNTVMLRFAATGADDKLLEVVTQK